jgi:hypothetical protein
MRSVQATPPVVHKSWHRSTPAGLLLSLIQLRAWQWMRETGRALSMTTLPLTPALCAISLSAYGSALRTMSAPIRCSSFSHTCSHIACRHLTLQSVGTVAKTATAVMHAILLVHR